MQPAGRMPLATTVVRALPSADASRVWLARTQGVVYLATGLWPLISIRTFERVTGPKVDRWLVKTVGVLVTVIGAVLLVAGRRRAVSDDLVLVAAGSAAGLAGHRPRL